MYVVKHETYPGDAVENSYQEGEIQVKKGIAVVRHVETKDYLFKLGYEFLGEIEKPEDLNQFLMNYEASLAGEAGSGLDVKQVDISNAGQVQGESSEKLTPRYWWDKDET